MSYLQHRRKAFAAGGGAFDKTGLEAWWELDDDSTWADSSGNGRDLTEDGTGVTNVTNGGTDGTSDSADFPGTSGTDYLTIAYDGAWMDTTIDTTHCMWIKPHALSGFQVFYDSVTGDGLTAYSSGSQLVTSLDTLNATATRSSASGFLVNDSWTFIAMRSVQDGNNTRYYLDATTVGGSSFDDNSNATSASTGISATLGIGRRPIGDTSNLFNGEMQRVSWWSRFLSDAELDDLYNSGNGLGYGDL